MLGLLYLCYSTFFITSCRFLEITLDILLLHFYQHMIQTSFHGYQGPKSAEQIMLFAIRNMYSDILIGHYSIWTMTYMWSANYLQIDNRLEWSAINNSRRFDATRGIASSFLTTWRASSITQYLQISNLASSKLLTFSQSSSVETSASERPWYDQSVSISTIRMNMMLKGLSVSASA